MSRRVIIVDHQPTRLPPVHGYRTHPLLPLREALDPVLPQIYNLESYISEAKTKCHFPSEHGLTREESAAIYLYTMEDGNPPLYHILNKMLREKERSVLVPWHGYLKLLDTALRKLPSLRMNLWRGIDNDVTKIYKANEKFTWWFFSSCSSAVNIVKSFLGDISISTLLMIEAKNGKDISLYSKFPEEREIILTLGTQLEIMGDVLDHFTLNVIHLRELTDDDDQQPTTSITKFNVPKPAEYKETTANEQSSSYKTITYDDGNRYEGDMKNGMRHGRGTFYYANGEKYVGNWVANKKEGLGVYTWSDGDRYETKRSNIFFSNVL